ncbi:MAG TPA: pantoate--beta-alanine ligase [Vicinamibacterales bacterium]|jgi:pantoate--beta-alanine ligase
MRTIKTVAEIREALERPRIFGIVGLVPTMGSLHAGHVALVRAARRECDTVVASLFVNPSQFNDPADLAAYPRDEATDSHIFSQAGVDYLFTPAVEEIYGPNHATWVDVEGAALGLEGAHRPGHFRGVATICLKLFTIVGPKLAFFGQKDAQQVAVVTQMVQDLNVPVEIRVVPTVRDRDGLALSSRNARLSPEERSRALAIPRALDAGLAAARAGQDPVAAARHELTGLDVDYVALALFNGHPTLAIAARAGRTRLIDNVRLDDRTVSIFGDLPRQEPHDGH